MENKGVNLKPYFLQASKCANREIFGVFLFGSQNYNLSDARSDIDVYCILMPNNTDKKVIDSVEVMLPRKERIEFIDIRNFIYNLVEGNIVALELLVTPFYIINDKYKNLWDDMRSRANEIVYACPDKVFSNLKQHLAFNYLRYLADNAADEDLLEYKFAPKQAAHVVREYDLLNRYNSKEDAFSLFITNKRDFLLEMKRGKYGAALTRSIVLDCVKKVDILELQIFTPQADAESVKEYLFKTLSHIMAAGGVTFGAN